MRVISSTILLLTFAVCASASLLTFDNQAGFTAAGSIVSNTNWNSFTGNFYRPGDSYLVGGLTFTSVHNLIVGPTSFYGNSQSMILSDWWTPLTANVNSTHNMLGFNAGVISGGASNSLVDISVFTNLNTYRIDENALPSVTNPLLFFGFVTGSTAESITGFSINSEFGWGVAPGITNVQVGSTPAAVPEPAPALLIGCGVLMLGVLTRRRHA